MRWAAHLGLVGAVSVALAAVTYVVLPAAVDLQGRFPVLSGAMILVAWAGFLLWLTRGWMEEPWP